MSDRSGTVDPALRQTKEPVFLLQKRYQVLTRNQEKIEQIVRPKFLLRCDRPEEAFHVLNCLKKLFLGVHAACLGLKDLLRRHQSFQNFEGPFVLAGSVELIYEFGYMLL